MLDDPLLGKRIINLHSYASQQQADTNWDIVSTDSSIPHTEGAGNESFWGSDSYAGKGNVSGSPLSWVMGYSLIGLAEYRLLRGTTP